MLLKDHLSKEDIRKFNQLRRAAENKKEPTNKPDHQSTPKKNKGNLSQRDWEDIMGTRRDIYTRKNGAVRRK